MSRAAHVRKLTPYRPPLGAVVRVRTLPPLEGTARREDLRHGRTLIETAYWGRVWFSWSDLRPAEPETLETPPARHAARGEAEEQAPPRPPVDF